jgi:short-subunit dehydrogenase
LLKKPIWLLSNYGKVIHMSSRAGLRSGGYDSAYTASKSGLIRLIESISEEVKDSNINVNCIMPSLLDTESNLREIPDADDWQKYCSYVQRKQE